MVRGENNLKLLVVLAATLLAAGSCLATGNVIQEMWQGAATANLDEAIAVVRGGTEPTLVATLPSLEYPGSTVPDQDLSDYVERLTAWVVAPVSGDYTFYIAGDDDCGLWIVNDANDIINVETTPPLCRVTGWSGFRDFTGNAERMSAPIALEAGTAYKLVAIHREGGGGDYVSVAWTLPGSATIDLITGAFITDEKKAGGPVPQDTAVDVKSGVLSWLPPAVSSGAENLSYDFYFGTDPNLLTTTIADITLNTTYDVGPVDGVTLAFSTAYYWRVNVSDPNEGGVPTYQVGDIWSFTTNDGKPFIITEPDDVFGVLNGTASFTVVAETLTPMMPLSYQWAYKSFFGDTWADIDGATEATYTKVGLEPSDRGLYRVTVSDTSNNSVSAEARLYLTIGLVNRYSFTDNAEDSVSGAHGTVYNAGYEDAPGAAGDPQKRQLFLNNSTRLTSTNALVPYVDLPNGLISTLGTQATFMVWFTWKETDTGRNWQRVFDFGNSTGGEGVSGTGNNYLMLRPVRMAEHRGLAIRTGMAVRNGSSIPRRA